MYSCSYYMRACNRGDWLGLIPSNDFVAKWRFEPHTLLAPMPVYTSALLVLNSYVLYHTGFNMIREDPALKQCKSGRLKIRNRGMSRIRGEEKTFLNQILLSRRKFCKHP